MVNSHSKKEQKQTTTTTTTTTTKNNLLIMVDLVRDLAYLSNDIFSIFELIDSHAK